MARGNRVRAQGARRGVGMKLSNRPGQQLQKFLDGDEVVGTGGRLSYRSVVCPLRSVMSACRCRRKVLSFRCVRGDRQEPRPAAGVEVNYSRSVCNLTKGTTNMARITRRGFVKASGALAAAAPALNVLSLRAQGPTPDTGNLRVEKDIVFGKGGTKDLTLDVYRPPTGVTSKRMAIVHLFGGGFFVGNKNAGYIINDAKALGARGYTSISANYRLQQEGLWPAQIHDTKAAIRWTRANAERIGIDPNRIVVAGYSAGGMLSLMAAGTNGRKEFEGDGGNAGVSSDVNACIGVYPLASAQIATGL